MPDILVKVSALPTVTTMAVGDKIPFVSTPGGTPVDKLITREDLFAFVGIGTPVFDYSVNGNGVQNYSVRAAIKSAATGGVAGASVALVDQYDRPTHIFTDDGIINVYDYSGGGSVLIMVNQAAGVNGQNNAHIAMQGVNSAGHTRNQATIISATTDISEASTDSMLAFCVAKNQDTTTYTQPNFIMTWGGDGLDTGTGIIKTDTEVSTPKVKLSQGQLLSGQVTIVSLNMFYPIPGSNGASGLLVLQDGAGGMAAILFQPAQVSTLLGTSTITGFSAADIGHSGSPDYITQIRLTSGSTNRGINWSYLMTAGGL